MPRFGCGRYGPAMRWFEPKFEVFCCTIIDALAVEAGSLLLSLV